MKLGMAVGVRVSVSACVDNDANMDIDVSSLKSVCTFVSGVLPALISQRTPE